MADSPPPTPITQPTAPNPTPGERELWDWMQEAIHQSDKARIDQAEFNRLDEWLRLFRGEHYPYTMPSHKPPVVINELRSLVLAEASDLADASPRVYITRNLDRAGRDVDLERAFRAVWAAQSVDLKLVEAIVWALVCGTAFLRVEWDPHANDGLGDVVVDVIDPRNVYPDPTAVDDRTWSWVITETHLSIPELYRLFPNAAARVPLEATTLQGPEAPKLTAGLPYTGPLSSASALLRHPASAAPRIRVLQADVIDDTMELDVTRVTNPIEGEPLTDDRGTPMLHARWVMKYPAGRRIIMANGVLLYDGPNPLPNAKMRPPDWGLVRLVLEPTLGQFWGLGFIAQTGQLQLAANKLFSTVVENAIRLNNGMLVTIGNTGLDLESFAGLPGQIVQLNAGSDIKVVYPPPMPPDMVQAPINALDAQRRILGFTPARLGAANTSPELTELEISQGQGLTRLRARMLAQCIQRVAEMIFARMAFGYTLPRQIPAVEGEKFVPVVWEPLERPEEYAVKVDPASFQILSRTMVRRLAVALYRMNAIDRRALLEHLGWPAWEEVAERLDRAERAAAEAKLAARMQRGKRA